MWRATPFFWAWPLVNVYNKRLGAEQSKELAYAGPVPAAPLNRIVMLTDYVAADERIVAYPNQDVSTAAAHWASRHRPSSSRCLISANPPSLERE